MLYAGAFDLESMRVSVEPYMGCSPQTCPDAYAKGSNPALHHRLKAPLLIVHGTADNDVPFRESEKLVQSLDSAGKAYEFVPIAGGTHSLGGAAVGRMEAAFFRKHLADRPISAESPGGR